jgi:aminoglycoside 6-adenylyltransferase
MERNFEVLLKHFVELAERKQDIRLVMVIGSRARENCPADEWSDLDLVFVTSNPTEYISNDDWLSELGEPVLTFIEHTHDGNVERRVLFEGGYDVDFVPIPLEAIEKGLPPEASNVLRRGWKIVVDKDNLRPLIDRVDVTPLAELSRPDQNDFQQTVYDFLYHAVWTAKKLRRGELWTAKHCCDGYMKWLLLKMIEWHATWATSDRRSVDVWHSGRFVETWADSRILKGLATSFAHYDLNEVWMALIQTTTVFRLMSQEVANSTGLRHPDDAFSKVAILLDTYHSES